MSTVFQDKEIKKIVCWSLKDVWSLITRLNEVELVGADIESTDVDPRKQSPVLTGKVFCFTFAWRERGSFYSAFVPCWGKYSGFLEEMKSFLEQESPKKIFHNGFSFDRQVVWNHGIKIGGVVDTLRMSKLLHSDKAWGHGLKDHMEKTLGYKNTDSFANLFTRPVCLGIDVREKAINSKRKIDGQMVPTYVAAGEHYRVGKKREFIPLDKFIVEYPNRLDTLVDYALLDAVAALELYEYLQPKLASITAKFGSLWDFYKSDWTTSLYALNEIERNGLRWSTDVSSKILKKISSDGRAATKALRRFAGEINLNSAKQLAEFIYDKLECEIPPVCGTSNAKRPTPEGKRPTDFGALEWLGKNTKYSAFFTDLLKFKETEKLFTYVLKLDNAVADDERIHCVLGPDTDTGRLSCVAEWTPIVTSAGVKPIKDVVVGDLVYTHKNRWRSVNHTIIKGVAPMYTFVLSNGSSITCTRKHEFLLASGEWITAGEYIDECIKELGEGPGECYDSFDTVSNNRNDHKGDSEETEHDRTQHRRSYQDRNSLGGAKSSKSIALVDRQTRGEEPYEGQNGRAAPQLEGSLFRRKGLSNVSIQWETSFCSSYSHDGGFEFTRDTGGVLCSSYRQQQRKQRYRELSLSHNCWASKNTLATREGSPECTVQKIYYSGNREVYDFGVDEDESYLACGVFSHNSRNPNLQQIPSHDNYGFKKAFRAPDGYKLVVSDFSQLELYILAHILQKLFKDSSLAADLLVGDIHSAVARRCWPDELSGFSDEVVREHPLRQAAKAVIYGLNYGKGPKNLGLALGIHWREAAQIINTIKSEYGIDKFQEFQHRVAKTRGHCMTILGRRRPLPHARLFADTDEKKRLKAAALRRSLNTPIQGSAADIVTLAMNNVYRSQKLRKLGAKLVMQVHDELILEVPNMHAEEAREELVYCMENPREGLLTVNLKVDAKIGDSWADCK